MPTENITREVSIPLRRHDLEMGPLSRYLDEQLVSYSEADGQCFAISYDDRTASADEVWAWVRSDKGITLNLLLEAPHHLLTRVGGAAFAILGRRSFQTVTSALVAEFRRGFADTYSDVQVVCFPKGIMLLSHDHVPDMALDASAEPDGRVNERIARAYTAAFVDHTASNHEVMAFANALEMYLDDMVSQLVRNRRDGKWTPRFDGVKFRVAAG